jgi:hypothetical protein
MFEEAVLTEATMFTFAIGVDKYVSEVFYNGCYSELLLNWREFFVVIGTEEMADVKSVFTSMALEKYAKMQYLGHLKTSGAVCRFLKYDFRIYCFKVLSRSMTCWVSCGDFFVQL